MKNVLTSAFHNLAEPFTRALFLRFKMIFGVIMLLIVATGSPIYAQATPDYRADFPDIKTVSPMGVNIQTGKLEHKPTEIAIGPLSHVRGVGYPHGAYMFWASRNTAGGGQQTEARVKVGDTLLSFAYVIGSTPSAPNFWSLQGNSEGAHWSLEKVGGQYKLTHKSGTVYTLDALSSYPPAGGYPDQSQTAMQVDFPDGSQVKFIRDTQDRLKYLISNRGYALVYDINTSNQITAICGFNLTVTQVSTSTTCSGAALKVSYTNLPVGTINGTISFTDVSGNVTNYVLTNSLPTCITLPNSSTCAVQNFFGPQGSENPLLTKWNQVRKQITANGDIWTYTYAFPDTQGDDPPPLPGGAPILSQSSYSAPIAFGAYAEYENGLLTLLQSHEGITTYEYSGTSPKKVTFQEGNSITFTRDPIGNMLTRIESPKPGSGLPANVSTQSFPSVTNAGKAPICNAVSMKLCTKPIYFIDPNGNRTDYTYDSAHGGVLTETGAAVNGIRPQTRYTYVQRNARDVNGTALQPAIWVLASEEYCKTTAASGSGCAGGASDEVVTTYDYGPTTGPNNLLLRGKVVDPTGLNLRTCYTYDQYGRKISETQPLGTGSTCP